MVIFQSSVIAEKGELALALSDLLCFSENMHEYYQDQLTSVDYNQIVTFVLLQ